MRFERASDEYTEYLRLKMRLLWITTFAKTRKFGEASMLMHQKLLPPLGHPCDQLTSLNHLPHLPSYQIKTSLLPRYPLSHPCSLHGSCSCVAYAEAYLELLNVDQRSSVRNWGKCIPKIRMLCIMILLGTPHRDGEPFQHHHRIQSALRTRLLFKSPGEPMPTSRVPSVTPSITSSASNSIKANRVWGWYSQAEYIF